MNEEETTEEKPKKRGRPAKPKAYRYIGRAKIHTSIGRFCEGDVIEGLPQEEVTSDMVPV